MAGTESVTVYLPWGTTARLGELVAAGRDQARQFRESRWVTAPARASAEARAAWRVATEQLVRDRRGAGTLLDTFGAVLEYGARAELRARGWDHDWPDPPAEALLSGRWPGSRDEGVPEKLVARVDTRLATRVRAACWVTSASAIAELRRWRDDHPSLVFDHALDRYDELSAQVTTTGEVWRAGISRVLYPPTENE